MSTIVPTWRDGLTAARPWAYSDGHNHSSAWISQREIRLERPAACVGRSNDLLTVVTCSPRCSWWDAPVIYDGFSFSVMFSASLFDIPRCKCPSMPIARSHNLPSSANHPSTGILTVQTDGKVAPLSEHTALGRSNPTARSAASCAAKRAQVATRPRQPALRLQRVPTRVGCCR